MGDFCILDFGSWRNEIEPETVWGIGSLSLQGMIEEMGLGEVIQALSLNRHRGTLRIEGEEGISKFFYLSDGEIVLIRTVKSEPVRIGELLVRAGKIDHEMLEAGLTLQKETKQRLGDALIALGHVNSH